MTDSRSRSENLGELDRWARTRVRVGGLVAALLTAVLLSFTHSAMRRPLFDAYQKIFPPPAPSSQIVVVAIDAPSLAQIGGWPWSRYTMARLAEQIAGRGAKAIGFDFLFSERDRQTPDDFVNLYYELTPAAAADIRRQESMDQIFAQVLGRYPTVLARFGVEQNSYDTPEQLDGASGLFPPEAKFVGPQPTSIPTYPQIAGSLDVLDGAAAGHGLANGPPDKDGIVRRVPLLGRSGGVLTPSLALELVRVAEGESQIQLEGDAKALKAIRVGRHRVPVSESGRVLLHFTSSPPAPDGKPQAAYPTISAVDLLRRGLPPDHFKDKIVLVGLVAAGTSDVVNTAREGRTYGVLVQAQAVDAILRGAALTQPFWAKLAEWAGGVALVLFAWVGVPRSRLTAVMTGAFAAIGAALAASGLAFQRDVLLSPIPMLAPAAVATITMVAMLFVEGRRVQLRLRGALESERLAAARVAGELAAASDIQAGMLLPRASLAAITPRAELDAVLQPARTVGGDLYDAFLIDPGRLCFLVGDVTGKGVPASLFMALSKALAHSLLARRNLDLARGVAAINRDLSRDNGQVMAVSMLVGVVDLESGQLDLCCAGHENPLVRRLDGTVEELRLDGGPPLCVDETFPYPIESFQLQAGETLVVLTDGVTEAQSPDGRLFGRAGAMAAIRGGPLPQLVDQLVAAVRAFEGGGEPSDDLTVLALRLSGR